MESPTLPVREQEICARLRVARETVGLTQREFAAEIGITRERIASYEDQRAPLRMDIALRVCRFFLIGERWLATGKGGMRHSVDLFQFISHFGVPFDMRYSEAFDDHLEAQCAKFERLYPVLRFQPNDNDNPKYCRNVLVYLADLCLAGHLHKMRRDDATIINAFRSAVSSLAHFMAPSNATRDEPVDVDEEMRDAIKRSADEAYERTKQRKKTK